MQSPVNNAVDSSSVAELFYDGQNTCLCEKKIVSVLNHQHTIFHCFEITFVMMIYLTTKLIHDLTWAP